MKEYTHDMVGQYIKLSGDGDRLTAICPFHEEETSSLVVDETKYTYHCFGCGAHGHFEDFADEFRLARKAALGNA